MSLFADHSCGCGEAPHPAVAPLPAGLATLPQRQRAGFPEYRHAMLHDLPSQPTLTGWRARGEADLGVLLLESWAYVLDVTGFYDARIAERAYLSTAPDAEQAQRIVDLLAYQPRGAISATVTLAVEADGVDPVTLPARTGFRSSAAGDVKAQVFETDAEWTIWPQRNRWTLAPVRDLVFDGVLRFAQRAAPSAGALLLIAAGTARAAARVLDVAPDPDPPGPTLQRIELAQGADQVAALAGSAMAAMSTRQLRLALNATGFGAAYTRRTTDGDLLLDAVYPQVRANEEAVIEIDGALTPVTITAATGATIEIDSTTHAKIAVTKVTITPSPTVGVAPPILHCGAIALPAPRSKAASAILLTDIVGAGALAEPIVALDQAPAAGTVIARGANKRGAALTGTIASDDALRPRFVADAGNADFAERLVAPVRLHGNVVTAVQGESVYAEVLGSGDAAKPWNSFTLKKTPLCWREDPSQPGGRRPDLTVRVNGIVWQWVPTLFDQPATAEVFTVRNLADGGSEIRFGDGKRGARVPSGVRNVTADYRFGATGKTPPPGSISQFAKKPKGLSEVLGPLPAQGGADPESAAEMRTAAPRSALTMGRAVSIADFEALARSLSGIVNVAAGWTWDPRRQRAVVRLWTIDESGEPGERLRAWLAGQAAPDVTIEIVPATPADVTEFIVALAVADRHDPAVVQRAAWDRLFAPGGLLAPEVQAIGAPLFRSVLARALHEVPGVAGVEQILVNGAEMPAAIGPGEGKWFDLAALAIVR